MTGSCSIGGHVEETFHAGSIGRSRHTGNPTNSVLLVGILCSNRGSQQNFTLLVKERTNTEETIKN
jgi:hypothetical protein